MAKSAKNFSSANAYKKWVAYGHINNYMPNGTHTPVKIKGKTHTVVHNKK